MEFDLFYDKGVDFIVELIIWLGNLRCPGHGGYSYMQHRVLCAIEKRLEIDRSNVS